MTTAELVNLILDRLRTGKVKFISIWEDGPIAPIFIEFEFGFIRYKVMYQKQLRNTIQVSRVLSERHTANDSYSRWVEGVLNGGVRNEAGEVLAIVSGIERHDRDAIHMLLGKSTVSWFAQETLVIQCATEKLKECLEYFELKGYHLKEYRHPMLRSEKRLDTTKVIVTGEKELS